TFTRAETDYTRFEILLKYLQSARPEFVINAAGYTGKPNVDACETNRAETLLGNALFPAALAHACSSLGIPFGHISSGCIYTGAKIVDAGKTRVETDLTKPELQPFLEKNRGAVRGFSEDD